jgi:hypothetical protein
MRSPMQGPYLVCSAVMAITLLVSGCDARPKQTAPMERPIIAPWQPSSVISACLDTPPLFPESYFRKAAAAVAEWIEKAVTVNFGGTVVYVSRISSASFEDDALTLRIPPIPADAREPTPPPSNGDYADADTVRAYQRAVATWQRTLDANHRYLAQVRHMVRQRINKLLTLADPYDDRGADVLGCLATASSHLQQTPGEKKYLVIASPMVNNVLLQKAHTLNFAGVTVEVIWRTCQIASVCQASDESWGRLFRQFGARRVSFKDPAESEASGLQF